MGVRPATEADAPAIIAMARALHAESPRYSRLRFSESKLEALLRSLTGTLLVANTGAVIVAEKGGEIVGMMAGYVSEHIFSYDKIATDYTFYLKPGHRGGLLAVKMLQAFEKWARAQGAVEITPGVSTEIDPEGVRNFYERMGYQVSGYIFLKELR